MMSEGAVPTNSLVMAQVGRCCCGAGLPDAAISVVARRASTEWVLADLDPKT